MMLTTFLFIQLLSYGFGYERHRKSLESNPLCTNVLPTPQFQSLYVSPQRGPQHFLEPVLNYSRMEYNLPCDSITIHSHDVEKDIVLSLLDEAEQDDSLRRIIILVQGGAGSNQTKYQQINQIIDESITSRPWWRVQEHENHETLMIHLDRVTREWENHVRFIGSVQYPPQEICRQTPILVSKENCVHPGWGAVFGMYGDLYRTFPFAIVAAYVSISNDPMENTAFIKGSDCPNELNKWHCAFLPTTNCTFPSAVTDCRSLNCIPAVNYGSGAVYTHADKDGQLVNLRKESDEVRSHYQTEIHSPLSQKLALKDYFIHPQYKYIMPYNRTWYEIKGDDVHDAFAEYATYGHYILFRMNSWYRSQVNHYIRSYRAATTPYFHPNSECVAIHIRRGDRTTAYNMHEICYNATHEPKLCKDVDGDLHPCGVQDLYCGYVPFGVIELTRTLQSIEQILPPITSEETRNILMFSDDYDWIQQETQHIKNDLLSPYRHWNFYLPPPPSSLLNASKTADNFHKYHLIRSEGGTASGIYLQATFQMVSQCNSFVGHFGSSFTGLLYSIMCHRHQGLEGYCPPMFDIKWDHEYYDKKYDEYVKQREHKGGS